MRALLFTTCGLLGYAVSAQYTLRGTVTDGNTGEPVPFASVLLKGTTNGVATDFDGRFTLNVSELPPYVLVISSMGYAATEVEVKSLDEQLKFKLSADQVLLKEAEVFGDRIGEKQKGAAVRSAPRWVPLRAMPCSTASRVSTRSRSRSPSA